MRRLQAACGKCSPGPVCCEAVSEENPDRVAELLLANGYTLYDWDAPARPKVASACFNTLALPADG